MELPTVNKCVSGRADLGLRSVRLHQETEPLSPGLTLLSVGHSQVQTVHTRMCPEDLLPCPILARRFCNPLGRWVKLCGKKHVSADGDIQESLLHLQSAPSLDQQLLSRVDELREEP